jgi:hypothetical protein
MWLILKVKMKVFSFAYLLTIFILFIVVVNIFGENEPIVEYIEYIKFLTFLKPLAEVLGFLFISAFLALSIIVLLSHKEIYKNLKNFHLHLLLFPFLVFLLGIFLRLTFFYLKPGVDSAGMDLLYRIRDFHFSFSPFGKFGWIFIHKIFSFFTGTTLKEIYLPNILLGSLTPIIIFLLTYLLFRRRMIAIISTLLFAISPIFLRISSTVSYTAPAIFFSMLTFLFLFLYLKKNQSIKFLITSLLSLYITIQTRTEYILLIPLFFITFLAFNRKENYPKNLLIIFFIFLTPYLLSMFIHYYYFKIDDPYVQGALIDKKNLVNSLIQNWIRIGKINFFKNLEILISGEKILQFNLLFGILGSMICLKRWKKEFVFLGSYFLIFFFAYTFLHSGGFFQYGGSDKYIPTLLPPIIIFSSIGIHFICQKLRTKGNFLSLLFLLGI